MANTFILRILTPGTPAIEHEVVSLVAPGAAGYLGVLADHAPLITTLGRGRLTLRLADQAEREYGVSGGILKVAHNRAVLLAETVEGADAAEE